MKVTMYKWQQMLQSLFLSITNYYVTHCPALHRSNCLTMTFKIQLTLFHSCEICKSSQDSIAKIIKKKFIVVIILGNNLEFIHTEFVIMLHSL